MDTIWNLERNLKSPVGNKLPITIYSNNTNNLFKVALLILITQHLNPGIVGVYSLVNKNDSQV